MAVGRATLLLSLRDVWPNAGVWRGRSLALPTCLRPHEPCLRRLGCFDCHVAGFCDNRGSRPLTLPLHGWEGIIEDAFHLNHAGNAATQETIA